MYIKNVKIFLLVLLNKLTYKMDCYMTSLNPISFLYNNIFPKSKYPIRRSVSLLNIKAFLVYVMSIHLSSNLFDVQLSLIFSLQLYLLLILFQSLFFVCAHPNSSILLEYDSSQMKVFKNTKKTQTNNPPPTKKENKLDLERCSF